MAAAESMKGGGAPRPHGGYLALPAAGRVREGLAFAAGAVVSALVLLSSASVLTPPPPVPTIVSLPQSSSSSSTDAAAAAGKGPRTFYDDPNLSYSVSGQRRITDWDAKRAAWDARPRRRLANGVAAGGDGVRVAAAMTFAPES